MFRRAVFAMLLAAPATAQTIGGAPPPSTTCVDVTIGDSRAYECVNRLLQAGVPPARTARPDLGVPANAQPNRTGTFNVAGTRQLLGNSFGRSVVPQRPTALTGPGPLFGISPVSVSPALARATPLGASGSTSFGSGAIATGAARGQASIGSLGSANRR